MLPSWRSSSWVSSTWARAYHLKNQLKNAAREGAIYGQTHPLSQTTLPAANNPSVPCANEQSIQARAEASYRRRDSRTRRTS